MTDIRGTRRPFQTLKRRLRRLPLRAGALTALGAAGALLVPATLGASALTLPATGLVALALAGLAADRWCWRHTRTAALRERYRKLGARMEQLGAHAAALRTSEEMHRALTETFGDVVAHLEGEGLDGVVTMANPMYRRLFGHHTETLPPSLLARLHAAGPEEGAGEVRVETAQGPRTLLWAARPALDAKGEPSTRFLARDVTGQAEALGALERARDEARAAAEAKGRMLATVSHEIRNPLNGLSGMAQLLVMAELAPRQKAQAEGILRASGALSRIIADLLDDARLETGKLDIADEPFDPRGLTEHACELMAVEALPKGVDLVARVSAAVPAFVEGDETRVRQVVLNLVGNAIKFTEEGQVTVRLDMVDTGQGRALEWSVEDTGPGLEPRDETRIFDIFAHADEGLARRLGGIGLGLAVSRQLAERMGGRLSLDTALGQGSTFSFHLPVGAEDAVPQQLGGADVLLITARPRLAGPLREQLAEWGVGLVAMDAAEWRRAGRWDGPILLDEGLGLEIADAVTLRRDTRETSPRDGRFLRLPWRRETLRRMLTAAPALEPALRDLQDRPDADTDADTGCSGRRDGRGLDVLLAEDDPVTQLMTTAHLERAGHRVRLAGDGGAAARLFREAAETAPFDAVVMDLNMGLGDSEAAMDGLAAVRAVRRIEAARKLRPAFVCVVTGDAREQTNEAARTAGADIVLTKPVEMEAMVATLDQGHAGRGHAGRGHADRGHADRGHADWGGEDMGREDARDVSRSTTQPVPESARQDAQG